MRIASVSTPTGEMTVDLDRVTLAKPSITEQGVTSICVDGMWVDITTPYRKFVVVWNDSMIDMRKSMEGK